MISNFKICQRVFLQVKIPSRVRLVGGHFGQNGQKVHESYKPDIFGAKQWVILSRTDHPQSAHQFFFGTFRCFPKCLNKHFN